MKQQKQIELLKPTQVDLIFKMAPGWTRQMCRQGRIPFIVLPDGKTIRIREDYILQIIHPEAVDKVIETIESSRDIPDV
jgi:hypothetical protein